MWLWQLDWGTGPVPVHTIRDKNRAAVHIHVIDLVDGV